MMDRQHLSAAAVLLPSVAAVVPLAVKIDKEGEEERRRERGGGEGGEDGQIRNRGLRLSRS